MRVVSEEDVQRTIIEGLTLCGYTVVQTSRRVRSSRQCAKCRRLTPLPTVCACGGRLAERGDGVTAGLPDLMVWKAGWHGWRGLEVKGPNTKVSPEQQALAEAGAIVIVPSWEDAIAAVGEQSPPRS